MDLSILSLLRIVLNSSRVRNSILLHVDFQLSLVTVDVHRVVNLTLVMQAVLSVNWVNEV